MAESTQREVSDGTLVLLDISIQYLDRSEISVFYDSLPTSDWSWVGVSEKRIAFSPAVPIGVEVLVKRTTDVTAIRHAFSLGAAFTPQALDEDLNQVLHIVQEATESNLSSDFYSPVNMHLNQIINVGPATTPNGVPTLTQLMPFAVAAEASAQASANSAIAAAVSAATLVGSSSTPVPNTGAGVVGVSTTFARGDHAHPAVVNIPGDAAGNGTLIGTSILWNGTAPPTNYMVEDGSTLTIADYPELFAVLGIRHGNGDGSGLTFSLPESRAEFLRGFDYGRGVDVGRVQAVAQAGQNAAHTHTGTTGNESATHTHGMPYSDGANGIGGANLMGPIPGALVTGVNNTSHTHSFTTDSSGGSEIRVRNVAKLICIRVR